MRCFYVVLEQSVGVKNVDEQCAFDHDDTTCKVALLSIIGDSLIDAYVHMSTGKAMWETLEARYGVSDAGSELYVME
jgi:hypothetical protein